jgi:GAF domain-containing protein
MHELTMLDSATEGARFCLEAILRVVPSLASLVLLRDPKRNDMGVVHTQGPRADRLLGTCIPVDALMTRAGRDGKPAVVTYGTDPGAEKLVCPRHKLFDPWSVLIVPVMHGGQLLGLIELIDPSDDHPFDEDLRSSIQYVAVRLGGFLADHATGATD